MLRRSARKTWMASSPRSGHDGAMTSALRRQHRAADQFALLQIDQRFVGLRERHRRHRNRRDLLVANEIEQFLGFAQIADIAALDRDRLDRNQRQRPGRAAAEQADDDELAALGQAVEAELRGLRRCRRDRSRRGSVRRPSSPVAPAHPAPCRRRWRARRRLRAASRLRASISTTMAPLPPIAFNSDSAIRPSPPAPKMTIGELKANLDLLQRAVGGDAGAGIGRRGDGIEPLQVQQIFRIRHRHVVGIAAVAIDAERVRLDDAHVLVAADAGLRICRSRARDRPARCRRP